MFSPIICFGSVLRGMISGEKNETFTANWDHDDLNNSNQKSTLQLMQ